MKTPAFILLLFLALATTSCQKHRNCCVLPVVANQISATKDGASWRAPSQIDVIKPGVTDTLILRGHIGEENIAFTLKRNSAGNYTLVDATYFTTVGQDAVVSTFVLDKSKDNTFTVTTSADEKNFQGNFSLYFKQTYGNTLSPAYPAALSFKDGIYKATQSSK